MNLLCNKYTELLIERQSLPLPDDTLQEVCIDTLNKYHWIQSELAELYIQMTFLGILMTQSRIESILLKYFVYKQTIIDS